MTLRDENEDLQDGKLPADPFEGSKPMTCDSADGNRWEKPIDPRRPETGPPLPIEGLPDWCQEPVKAIAANVQSPLDYVIGVALGIVSGGVMGRWVLDLNDYRVHPNLSVLGILASGERKSEPISRLLRPLAEVERTQRQQRESSRASSRAQREALNAQKNGYLRKVAKDPECGLGEQLEHIEQQLAEINDPGPLVLMADDVTPEKAADIAKDNHGILRVYSDEGAFIQHLLGRYASNPALEMFLNGWSGGRTVVHRVSRDPIIIDRVLTSVVAAVQPSVVAAAAGNESMVRRGGLARFLMVCPKTLTGTRLPLGAKLDRVSQDWFADQLRQLYRMEASLSPATGRPEPAPVTLSPEGIGRFEDTFRRFEARRAPTGDLAPFVNIVNKFEGHVLKVTLAIWAAERDVRTDASYTNPGQIPGEYVERAVAFMEAQLLHQLAAVRLTGKDETRRHAVAILDHVSRHHTTKYEDLVASRRDLYRNLASRFDDPHDMDDPLGLLERLGWVRPAAPPHSSGAGRPPSERFEFHPDLRGWA